MVHFLFKMKGFIYERKRNICDFGRCGGDA